MREADTARNRALDAYLVASARLGDRNALAMLARRWNCKLAAHAWRLLGDREAARDAVQDSWLEIVRSLHRLANDHAFPAWALRIVSRRCGRTVRTEQRRRRLQEAVAAEPVPEPEPGRRPQGRRCRPPFAR